MPTIVILLTMLIAKNNAKHTAIFKGKFLKKIVKKYLSMHLHR